MAVVAQNPVLYFCLNFISLISVVINAQSNQQPQPVGYLFPLCSNSFTYTEDSMYRSNLNNALSRLGNTNSGYGFFNISFGQGIDRVNAISLCRGDIDSTMCQTCMSETIFKLRDLCRNQTEAIIYYDNCFLRYSNATILGEIDDGIYMWKVNNASNPQKFSLAVRSLMNKLRYSAAAGSSVWKFATDNTTGPNFLTIYGLAQCVPSLSQQQCNDCLESAFRKLTVCCDGKIGGRVLSTSCNIRYEVYRFTNNTSVIPPPLVVPSSASQSSPPVVASPPSGNNHRKTKWMVIIGPSVIVITLTFIVIFILLRRKETLTPKFGCEIMDISSDESLNYDFHTISAATNEFCESNKLGQGGFGPVYKGVLPDGQAIAVKRLSNNSGQGEIEFKNEVDLVAKLQHRNLVKLLGFTLQGTERLLIYEFVPNGSLDQYIFDPTKRTLLDWDTCYKIIGGVARGLLYLHEDSRLRIIHRDLKAGNILLDLKMDPKVADFGMARLFKQEENEGNTNRIVGTFGYMAPEYAAHGEFSVKSDVFSFGVLVLEMVSGLKNHCFRNGESIQGLLGYAWNNFRDGTVSNMIDPTLKGQSNSLSSICRTIHIGLLCVQNNVVDRPTMSEVVFMLKSISVALPIPSEPAFFIRDSGFRNISNHLNYNFSEDVEGQQLSVTDGSVTEIVPR